MNKRYIPENSKEIKRDDLTAVAYTYESLNGALYALAYSGRRNKPDFHYRFANEEKRSNAVAKYFQRIEANAQYKQEHKKRQKELQSEFINKIKVGSIFSTCWGYDQTNIEWYQVTQIKGYTVRLRQIAAKIENSETKPMKGMFIGEELKRLIRSTGIRIDNVVTAHLSDGKSKYHSSYNR